MSFSSSFASFPPGSVPARVVGLCDEATGLLYGEAGAQWPPGGGALLGEELRAVRAAQDRQRLALAEVAARFQRSGGLAASGYASLTDFLMHRCGASYAEAASLRRVAERMGDYPLARDAAACGRLSFAALDLIIQAVDKAVAARPTARFPDAAAFRTEAEEILIGPALKDGVTLSDLKRLGACLFATLAPDLHEREYQDRYATRGARASRTFAGGGMFHAWGDEGGYAILKAALRAFTQAPSPGDDRTQAQRTYDAFIQALEVALAAAGAPVPRDEEDAPEPADDPDAQAPEEPGGNAHDPDTPTPDAPAPENSGPHGSEARGAGSEETVSGEDAAPADGPLPDMPQPQVRRPAPGLAARAVQAGLRPHVNVVVTLDQLRLEDGAGPAHTDDGTLLPPSLAQALASGAPLRRIVCDPLTGDPVDLGRTTRIFPKRIRDALLARHTTCQWHEGCSVPAQWCQVDHAHTEWWQGGTTSLDNAQLLCGRHNRKKYMRKARAYYRSRQRGTGGSDDDGEADRPDEAAA